MSERWFPDPDTRSPARAVLIAVGTPAAALGVALLVQPERELGAVSLFLLAVVAAAVLGGLWAGVGSSVLGFLSLNFFFTEPLHTLHVRNRDDVLALVVFLIVALVVGWVVARAVRERDRASRREREARLLNYIATKALSGEPVERVVGDLAAALVDALRLAWCRIEADVVDRRYEVTKGRNDDAARGSGIEVAIESDGETFGRITASKGPGEALPVEDVRLLGSAARQIAVLIDREVLDARVAEARLDAERSQTRAALFSSVTHDLRTPLASIKAAVTSLLQRDIDLAEDERQELLTTVREETDRLNRLIGNILELAKVRAGALTPAREPIALDEVVEAVLHRMEPSLRNVRVRTILREAPEVPADPVQIDQVLSNLIENAARYSPSGGEIVVSVAPWHSTVQVRIVDQGPGIAPEERQRVFEAFARGPGSDRGGGSGLGLAIARAIVLAHGGRIWIEGAPGSGTAVVFELPIREARPVPQEVASTERTP